MSEDEHPMDKPIGTINAIAIKLAMLHQHDLAIPLAEAVGKIEAWILMQSERAVQELEATAVSIWMNQEMGTLAVAKAMLDLIKAYARPVGHTEALEDGIDFGHVPANTR